MDRFAAMIILLSGLVVSRVIHSNEFIDRAPSPLQGIGMHPNSHDPPSCLQTAVLVVLALFAISPITCSCLVSLLYTLYLFIAYEESGLHYAQEFEVSPAGG